MREYDQMVKESPNFIGIDVEEDTYLFPNVAMTLSGPYVFDRFRDDDLANNPERMKLLEETAELFAKWNAGRPRPCPNDPLAYCLPPEN